MIGFKYQCRYVVLANIKFIQSLQQEPTVLERSVKLDQVPDKGDEGDRGDGGDGGDRGSEVDLREVSTIRLGMLESSGFRTLLAIQLFFRRLCLCLCHCLCIRLCLCICVPYSFFNSYYHKLSENVWVWGCGASRSEIWSDVTMAGRTNNQTTEQGKIELLSQWTMEG